MQRSSYVDIDSNVAEQMISRLLSDETIIYSPGSHHGTIHAAVHYSRVLNSNIQVVLRSPLRLSQRCARKITD
jgi:hypothetical protein